MWTTVAKQPAVAAAGLVLGEVLIEDLGEPQEVVALEVGLELGLGAARAVSSHDAALTGLPVLGVHCHPPGDLANNAVGDSAGNNHADESDQRYGGDSAPPVGLCTVCQQSADDNGGRPATSDGH